ncbi:hypothetical protein [Terasakiella pusilla]|uniref:hypothetical protein n=1 Tax=Terasakiella pusilla TaxID=64973 RepID=UPI003AA985F5
MIVRLFLSGLLLLAHSFLPANALEVTAQGATQRQALNNALRQAVEMTFGSDIEANTLVENFQVVRQQLLKQSRGFVRSYEILRQSQSENGLYEVTLNADVDDTNLKDSTRALSTIMQMASHPRVMVAGIDEDFDALSSLNPDFQKLTDTVELILKDDFKFKVLNKDLIRLESQNSYRFSDRKNNLKRARQAKADYLIFVELVQTTQTSATLKLESLDLATGHTLALEETTFAAEANALEAAHHHVYAPSAQISAAMVENLTAEIYDTGQRFELSFFKFDPKTLSFLEADLSSLPGYVRHKMAAQDKNALSLSYWSMLETGALHEHVSALLKAQDIPFNFYMRQRSLTYLFDDPMFE